MRLIDADTLAKEMLSITYLNCDDGYYKGRVDERDDVLRRIADAPIFEPDNWIKCSDRLPEPGERVLMLIDDTTVFEGWYQIDGWRRYEKSDVPVEKWLGKVTRWMPLPEPPQEESVMQP